MLLPLLAAVSCLFEKSIEMYYPKISIIVPFYNVADCVDYCLRSLVRQSYSNYEVICVDDGSTDETAKRIENFAERYRGIKLFRKENGGLSDARNYGVSRSSGEYITFVDGDDLVSPDYLDTLIRPIIEGRCDIAIGCHRRLKPIAFPFNDVLWDGNKEYEIVSESEAVSRLLYGTPILSAWAHMVKREVYEKYPFPVGKVYEDTLTFGQHVMGFERYALCAGKIYGYVLRSGSITSQVSACCSRVEELVHALDQLRTMVLECDSSLEKALVYHESIELCRILVRIQRAPRNGRGAKTLRVTTIESLRRNLRCVFENRNIGMLDKARIGSAAIVPRTYCTVVRMLSKII